MAIAYAIIVRYRTIMNEVIMRQNAAIKEYYDLYLWSNELYSRFAKAQGETDNSFFTLFFIFKNPEGISFKAIRESVQIPKLTLSSTLDSLKKRSLIEECLSDEDKRSKVVFLTEEGQAYCSKIFAALADVEKQCLNQMNIADFEAMNASLKQFLTLFDTATSTGE